MSNSYWADPSHVERLLELNDQVLSASQIARGLGGGISRNAVIGKLSRMGVGLKHKAVGGPRIHAPNTLPKAKPVIVKQPELPAPEFIGPIGAFPADNLKTCRYPEGDTSTSTYQMCGQDGFPYCPYHRSVCYEPIRTQASNKKAERTAAHYDAMQDRAMRRMGLG